jgi:transposase
MAVLDPEELVTLKTLARLGVSNVEIAGTLGVTEGTVRYHRRRLASGARDGRANKPFLAESFREAVDAYLEARQEDAPSNVQDLHDFLVAEHAYPGSLRSVQRFVRSAFAPPPVRTRRRVETPPGAQAQADWAVFPRVALGVGEVDLVAFVLQLSFSRGDAIVWSDRRDMPSWLEVHLAAFVRLQGVPATVRVDNEKTAVVRGAGAWGELHPTYRRFAQQLRFHVDACAPRAPQAKGKVERRIREARRGLDPYRRRWRDVGELQAFTDTFVHASWATRVCPATGGSVLEALELERRSLSPLPERLPEPFDVAVRRRAGVDATVRFEGRTYSVPFVLANRDVVLHGTRAHVQVFAGDELMAQHPRGSRERILIDPRHYQGDATPTHLPPQPLGRFGERIQEIMALPTEQRPIDLYAALAEVAR